MSHDLPRHEQIATQSVAGLSPEERLIWLLGDMMNAVENLFCAENPKREGHIYHCAIRILDEVVTPLVEAKADLRNGRFTVGSPPFPCRGNIPAHCNYPGCDCAERT